MAHGRLIECTACSLEMWSPWIGKQWGHRWAPQHLLRQFIRSEDRKG